MTQDLAAASSAALLLSHLLQRARAKPTRVASPFVQVRLLSPGVQHSVELFVQLFCELFGMKRPSCRRCPQPIQRFHRRRGGACVRGGGSGAGAARRARACVRSGRGGRVVRSGQRAHGR
eukprot:1002328-Pleurochrysis_carterae.AAC.1